MPTSVAACVCEQLTVSCSGDPAQVTLCHCLACQRRTGSTYGIAAFYPAPSQAVYVEHRHRWVPNVPAGSRIIALRLRRVSL